MRTKAFICNSALKKVDEHKQKKSHKKIVR